MLLRSETFFNLNRAYLVASAAFAFFIPLMQSVWVRHWFVTEQVSQTLYTFYNPTVFYLQKSQETKNLTLGDLLAVVYVIGILIGIARFGGNLVFLAKLMKRKINHRENKTAFSFFNMLFVSKELQQRSTILKHEFVHIRQLHSADVMLFELIAIFNWFNPVVYLYKNSIKYIHEFIADEIASRHEASKADYAMLLFQEQFGVKAIPLTNNFFNHSLLKQRIKMLNKERSAPTGLMKYGLIAPLFMVMIVVSSATIAQKELAQIETKIERVTDKDLNEIIEKPTKTGKEVLAADGIDLSQALIISPALMNEVKTIKKDTTNILDAVEENPAFVDGGMNGFAKFLQKNLQYPQEAQKANITGKIYTEFVVNTDGSATNFTTLKGIGYGCDEEAIRVLKLAKWIPGKQSGQIVRCKFVVPIYFQIGRENPAAGIFTTKNIEKIPSKIKEEAMVLNYSEYLLIVDGKETNTEIVKKLNPENIEKMEILKGQEARKQYGEKGRNGVLVIMSKKE
jgi:TonB family protein